MVFVTCIQDNIYLNWQVELLYYNLKKLGVKLITLCGFTHKPSNYALQLEKNLDNYILIEDTRTNKSYAATMQPFLLSKYNIKDKFFLCDSDVLFKDIDFLNDPNFQNYDVIGSNCGSYVNNEYINGCDSEILSKMCQVANVDFEKISSNKLGIGAQYIFNKIPSQDFWKKVEQSSNNIYTLLSNYKCKIHDIQIWTAEMWGILFNLVSDNYNIYSNNSMNFSWASDNISTWKNNNIFHCAGVTNMDNGHFFKGAYTKYTPFFQNLSYVKSTSCSHIYKEFILEYKNIRDIK